MTDIVGVHFSDLPEDLLKSAMDLFYKIRRIDGIRKRPSTSELVDWIAALLGHGVSPEKIEKEIPFLGVLLKREHDVATTVRLLASSGRSRLG